MFLYSCKKQSSQDPLVTLGHELFFETRLSANNTKSCSSCHNPKFAFTDGYRTSTGIEADVLLHNAPTLLNTSFNNYYDWANPETINFEQQMLRPLFSQHPKEMGMKFTSDIAAVLKYDPKYILLFNNAFPKDNKAICWQNIVKALSAYQRQLLSFNSKFDKYYFGDKKEKYFTASELRGKDLFFSQKTKCASCHTPPLFTVSSGDTIIQNNYSNIGLYEHYPSYDLGISTFTCNKTDEGKFKIPTLRNLVFTAPYMHDGSIATLAEVIDMYSFGGRELHYGNNKGNGKNNTNKDNRIHGFEISEQEKKDLILFLHTLTDSSIFANPLYNIPNYEAH